MSAEHGTHGEAVNFTNIIATIFLAVLGIAAITEPVEDVVKLLIQGEGEHH